MAPTQTLPPAAQAALERRLAELSFPDFLRYVLIENTEYGGLTPFQAWPHLIQMAESWQSGQSEIVLKSRQLGVSWLLAAYLLWSTIYCRKPGFRSLALSQGKDYSVELLRKVRVIHSNLPYHLQANVLRETQSELEIEVTGEDGAKGIARIISLPSTENAGRSFTADRIALDEFGFHDYASANLATLLPTIADNPDSQMLIVSTANGPSGAFYKVWDAPPPDFNTRFVPWFARPGRDNDWLEKQRGRFVGMEQAFKAEYPSTPDDAFRALAGLVYEQFEPRRHVYTHKKGSRTAMAVPRSRVGWEDMRYRLMGIDPGGGDPTALIPIGIDKDGHFWQPDEKYGRGFSIDDWVEYIEKWDHRAPFDRIEVDLPEDSAMLLQLRNLGYPAYAAHKNRPARLNTQGWALDNNRLHIHEECTNSIHEFYGYRYSERRDPYEGEKYKTSTPVDHHADAMDARGYAILYAMTYLIGQEPEEFGELIPMMEPELQRDLTPPWKRIF